MKYSAKIASFFLIAAALTAGLFSLCTKNLSTSSVNQNGFHLSSDKSGCATDMNTCAENTTDHTMTLFSERLPATLTEFASLLVGALLILRLAFLTVTIRKIENRLETRVKQLLKKWRDLQALLPLALAFRKGTIQPKVFA